MTKKNDFGLPSLEEVMKMANKVQKDVSQPSLDQKVGKVESRESVYSTQYKGGLLYVQLTDLNYFNYYDLNKIPEYYNNREVEIMIHKSKEVMYLTTDTYTSLEGFYYKYNPGVCKKILLGGNYTVKATVDGETVSRNITIDGDTRVLLQFKRK